MDIKNEDTIVRQIEKNLSNNMNENLFLAGNLYGGNSYPEKRTTSMHTVDASGDTSEKDYPLVSYDYISNPQAISRAEYIRQARESCLRNLSNNQIYSHAFDVNYMDQETGELEQEGMKKPGLFKFFQDNSSNKGKDEEGNNPQELAAFRFLIIRTVCAVLIFLTIFFIDKLELKIGNITHHMIKEYVTGKDTLQVLEDIILTWIK